MKPPYPWEIRDCSFDWERCGAVKGLGQPEFYLLKDFESDKRKDLFWAEQYKTLIKLSVIYLARLQYAKIEENHMTPRNEKIQQIIACYLADAKPKLHHTLL